MTEFKYTPEELAALPAKINHIISMMAHAPEKFNYQYEENLKLALNLIKKYKNTSHNTHEHFFPKITSILTETAVSYTLDHQIYCLINGLDANSVKFNQDGSILVKPRKYIHLVDDFNVIGNKSCEIIYQQPKSLTCYCILTQKTHRLNEINDFFAVNNTKNPNLSIAFSSTNNRLFLVDVDIDVAVALDEKAVQSSFVTFTTDFEKQFNEYISKGIAPLTWEALSLQHLLLSRLSLPKQISDPFTIVFSKDVVIDLGGQLLDGKELKLSTTGIAKATIKNGRILCDDVETYKFEKFENVTLEGNVVFGGLYSKLKNCKLHNITQLDLGVPSSTPDLLMRNIIEKGLTSISTPNVWASPNDKKIQFSTTYTKYNNIIISLFLH